ncbi:MAG: C45 family peptidase [Pirellulales bacterium]|nr:C45 family peptidase [Pirellulales bacterium]
MPSTRLETIKRSAFPVAMLAVMLLNVFAMYPWAYELRRADAAISEVPQSSNHSTLPVASTSRQQLRVVVLEGDAYERGLKHGKELRNEIAGLMGHWKAWIKDTFKQDPDDFIATFLNNSRFLEAAHQWQPEILDEVRGIAEGAEADFDTMFAYQLIDEMWAMGQDLGAHHCSSIGIDRRGDQATIVAQNLDLPEYMHGFQTLLHIKMPPHEDDVDGKLLQIYTFTLPGIVAANGINNYGVAVACNTVLQLKPDPEGLPVDFVVRGLLDCRSREDAVAFARSVRHASGQNYIIGGKNEAWCLECSQDVVTRFEPSAGCGYTYHTNHPVVNENYTDQYRARVEAARAKNEPPTVSHRFESLEKRLNDPAKINIQSIRETLASQDHPADPICNAGTYGTLIMVLEEKPYLLLAPGAPNKTEFQRFDFE